MEAIRVGSARRVPWNKGKLTGQKPPLKLREIWAIRIRLQLAGKTRDLALFNLAIDSKLRACDLTRLRVSDICLGSRVAARATIMQQTTQRPVQFEITEQTRTSVEAWRRGGVDASRRAFGWRLSVSESHPRLTAPVDPTIRSTGPSRDTSDRTG